MMMNRTKSAVDALIKLRIKGICMSSRSFTKTPFSDFQIGLESGPPIHPNPRSLNVVDHSGYIDNRKNIINLDEELNMLSKMTQKHPLPFVDDFFKKSCVPFIVTLLDGLICEDRIYEAYMMLNKLVKQKLCEPNTLMYNTVIKALCNNPDKTMMDDALKLFQEMVSQPDVGTYNSLVSGLCKIRRWTKATLLIKEMLDKDISPDVETFNVLINTFCIDGKLQVARHVIYMMRERGISPNIATYNPIIDAHCLKGEMDQARSLFNLLVSNHVDPNTTTYTSLLNGYCNDAKMDDAMLVYHEMNEKGFKPNPVTYNSMIRSFFKAARFEDAHTLLDDLLAQGQTLDERTYSYILPDLCHNYRFEEAFNLFHTLGEDSKLNSDVFILDKLMYGAIRCGKLDIARELFKGLSVKGIKPNSLVYTTMISGFCAEGLLNDAKQLFLEMEENHYCQPNNDTYNILLQGYLKNKCYDDVEMLLHKMEERNLRLYDLTLSLIHESVAAGSLDRSIINLLNNLPR